MIPYEHVRMELKTSKQIAAYLKTNDMVILPVGCTEMHGPLMPLGTDTFIDWATALALADCWNCLCLYPIPYVYPGASDFWPGTIAVSPEDSMAYVKAVVKACLRAGFKRTVICAAHGPMGFMGLNVIRSIYQESGDIVMHFDGWKNTCAEMEKEFGRASEDLVVLGAMKILELDSAYDPHATVDKEIEFPYGSFTKLRGMGGKLPWIFNRDYQHAGLRTDLHAEDAERAAECIKRAAGKTSDIPALFAQYQKEMKELGEAAPWERDDVWTV